ncbi:hypothetical protein PAEPH01_1201 [Pancytospora epiphaga]|nr:hypothetical protein PAEPH01_1201 [Pancytospora epiphaga]
MERENNKGKIRPIDKFTYYSLIRRAIESYPAKRACIFMIYNYLIAMFPNTFRPDNKKAWFYSIRNTLTRHKEFSCSRKTSKEYGWTFTESEDVNRKIRLLNKVLGLEDEDRDGHKNSCFHSDWKTEIRKQMYIINRGHLGNNRKQMEKFWRGTATEGIARNRINNKENQPNNKIEINGLKLTVQPGEWSNKLSKLSINLLKENKKEHYENYNKQPRRRSRGRLTYLCYSV